MNHPFYDHSYDNLTHKISKIFFYPSMRFFKSFQRTWISVVSVMKNTHLWGLPPIDDNKHNRLWPKLYKHIYSFVHSCNISTANAQLYLMMTSSMDAFSTLLALCEGNPPVTGGFPSDAELWCFLWSAPEQTVQRTIKSRYSLWHHCNIHG